MGCCFCVPRPRKLCKCSGEYPPRPLVGGNAPPSVAVRPAEVQEGDQEYQVGGGAHVLVTLLITHPQDGSWLVNSSPAPPNLLSLYCTHLGKDPPSSVPASTAEAPGQCIPPLTSPTMVSVHRLILSGGVALGFSVESRSTGRVNDKLQAVARTRLWSLENDSQEVETLFKELSARLLSIQTKKDQFLITFKTVDEIWKFSTYLNLGLVASCLQHLLLDGSFWLDSALVDDTEVRVEVGEAELAAMYLDLLLQEGHFFARALGPIRPAAGEEAEGLELHSGEMVSVQSPGTGPTWEVVSLSTGRRGLVPRSAVRPLPHPFQHFCLSLSLCLCCCICPQGSLSLGISLSQGLSPCVSVFWCLSLGVCRYLCVSLSLQFCLLVSLIISVTLSWCLWVYLWARLSLPVSTGSGQCRAVDDCPGEGPDELSFRQGDTIQVIGLLVPGLQWFLGKSNLTGDVGFVRTEHVDPSSCKPLGQLSTLLGEDEPLFPGVREDDGNAYLSALTHTDITTVYRLSDGPPDPFSARRPQIQRPQCQRPESWSRRSWSQSSQSQSSQRLRPRRRKPRSRRPRRRRPRSRSQRSWSQSSQTQSSQSLRPQSPRPESRSPQSRRPQSQTTQTQSPTSQTQRPRSQSSQSRGSRSHRPQNQRLRSQSPSSPRPRSQSSILDAPGSSDSLLGGALDEDPALTSSRSGSSDTTSLAGERHRPTSLPLPEDFGEVDAGVTRVVPAASSLDPVLTFLNQDRGPDPFRALYGLAARSLPAAFPGASDEVELTTALEAARAGATRHRLPWARARLCFLLGRLSRSRLKLSQARVYFEEALRALPPGFADLPLAAALHTHLAAVYLCQKVGPRGATLLGKAAALLVGQPVCGGPGAEDELAVVTYALREGIVAGSAPLESRACFLAARLLTRLGRGDEALPFVERLRLLTPAPGPPPVPAPAPGDPTATVLPLLYDRKYLPRLALAAAQSRAPTVAPLPGWGLGLVLRSTTRLSAPRGAPGWGHISPLACPALRGALADARAREDIGQQRRLCLALARAHLQHGRSSDAIRCLSQAMALAQRLGEAEAFECSLCLGWACVMAGQAGQALDVLGPLVRSPQGAGSHIQHGTTLNLLALALQQAGQVQAAGRHFALALRVAQEAGHGGNQAVALANLGHLALTRRAPGLATRFLLRAARGFLGLPGGPGPEGGRVLLWLGRALVDCHRLASGRIWYEMALLLGLESDHLETQLLAVESLCEMPDATSPSPSAPTVYHEHRLVVARRLGDRGLEAEVLGTLSRLYQSRGSPRALQLALGFTKQRLKILIDLEDRAGAARAWLAAGRLHYLLHHDELVDLYLQAAIRTALTTEEPGLVLSLYEEAGDVFFDGSHHRHRAAEFYREGAVPLARRAKATNTELRLFNKLTELQISLGAFEKALEVATLAARLSTIVGDQRQELVAFHRLATVYYFLQMYELAEDCYLKTLALCPPTLQGAQGAMFYTKVYCRLGVLTFHQLKDAHDAAGYFWLALAAAIELGDVELQAAIRARLGAIQRSPLWGEASRGRSAERARWLSQGGHAI
ncbi:SH3 domain and tetratricopeptide repeat-containing protein 2 [Ornithorhynchus anatinus]|uniref:SH3 domain and tetratricopeptide repeat-containing protein 2 n=1 Tax=Ornithorhynchus anatinus TaxID=9258 RepID=UPI0019D487C2|nr:SH3 domain and tetratricopeptide repeat-containing protein 2 [Ornithorhynchus anatinus]